MKESPTREYTLRYMSWIICYVLCVSFRYTSAKDVLLLQKQSGVMEEQAFPIPSIHNLFEFITGYLRRESSPLSR